MTVSNEQTMIKVQAGEADDDVVIRVGQLMDQMMQKSFFRFRPCDRWQPAINFYETQNAYYICVDLPGIDAKQIELHIQGQTLRISGHRPAPSPEGAANTRIHVMEIDHGSFQRSIQVPDDVDTQTIRAFLKHGFIWIELKKK